MMFLMCIMLCWIKAWVSSESYSAIVKLTYFLSAIDHCLVNHMLTLFLCFFFFQAEDGIRDIGVTGVQTCALPIYSRCGYASSGHVLIMLSAPAPAQRADSRMEAPAGAHARRPCRRLREGTRPQPERSEERRVGKECRSRWSPYH